MRFSVRPAVCALLVVLLGFVGASAASAAISVVNYQLVSSTRVGRTTFDYSYRVTFQNSGSAESGVIATVTSTVPTTGVLTGQISVGNMPAGAATTPDGLISIRQDRTVAFSFQNLVWTFGSAQNGPLSPQERTASMAAIDAEIVSLPRLNVLTDNQALVQFILARPEFANAGTSDNGLTVWGVWRDGVQYLILRNREPTAPTNLTALPALRSEAPLLAPEATATRPSPITAAIPAQVSTNTTSPESGHPSNLPALKQMRLLNAMGPGFGNPLDTLRGYLAAQKYQEVTADATVEGLKLVGGDGVFYFNTHGGAGSGTFALWSATERTEANEEKYTTDMDALRLVIMRACFDATIGCIDDDAHAAAYKKHYGITAQFIADWGQFADHSLVYLDACESASLAAGALNLVLLGKNAGLILEWDFDVLDADGGGSAFFMFDRLLGANDYRPTKPQTGFNQRPFDWMSARKNCLAQGLCSSVYKGVLATLIGREPAPGCFAAGACNQEFGLLAPSIRQMWVYEAPDTSFENDILFISGFFGLDPGSGPFDPARSVSIGGTPVAVMAWSPNMIAVNLPHTAPGVSGDVIVSVHDHTSNVAQLTEWNVPFTFDLDDFQSLEETVKIGAHFRADIRKTVQRIGEAPAEPTGSLPPLPDGFQFPVLPPDLSLNTLLDDTKGRDGCTGTATTVANGQSNTETWSGNRAISYKNDENTPNAANSYIMVQDSRTIVLTLEDWEGGCTDVLNGSRGVAPGLQPGEISPAKDNTEDGNAVFFLDAAGTISGNSMTQRTFSHSYLDGGGNAKATWQWPDSPPVAGAPNPDSAR